MNIDKELTIQMLKQLFYNSTFLNVDELKKIEEILKSIESR